jgi:acyl carrier protein
MERTEAFEALREAAVEVLSVEPAAVTEAASFADDLDADSLDLVELVMAVEDRLGVSIGEDDLGDVRTVGDAVSLILAAAASKV